MDNIQPRTKIDLNTFWENIRNGTHDPHNFQEKLLQKNTPLTKGTQSWKIPPGILTSLNSRNWKTFGGAVFREEYFPLDFDSNPNRINFLERENIKSRAILNPPFADDNIEKFLSHIIHLQEENHKHYFVMLPWRTTKTWFQKYIVDSQFCKLKFKNKIAFLRGEAETFHGIANEEHFLWIVGVNGPLITVDNTPLGDFEMEWRLFAQLNFLHNIEGKPPLGKIKEWIHKLKKQLKSNNDIRIKHFEKLELKVKKIYTPWAQTKPEETNVLEDNIRNRTPEAWSLRLRKISKKKKLQPINSKKAHTLFQKVKKRNQTNIMCELCLSTKHSTKFCTQAMPTKEDMEYKPDRALFEFFEQLPTENNQNIYPILKQSDLPEEKIVERFQPNNYNGPTRRKQLHAIKCAQARAYQCKTVMEKLGLTWDMPPNLTFSHVRFHISYYYGYGFPKKYLLRLIKGYRICPEIEVEQRLQVYHKQKISKRESDKYFTTIRKRMLQGKIVPIMENSPIVISPEFTVEQTDKLRPVLDCSALNELYEAESIRFPTTDTAIKSAKNSWVAAVDLSSAYNQAPIFPPDLQFFGITSENSYFIPTGLPQGFNRAPEIFTRFLDQVVELFIDLDIPTVKLLDDLLFVLGEAGTSTEDLQQTLDNIRQIIADLGLRTNEKSQEGAYSEIVYLGKLVNTALGKTFITPEKLDKTITQCLELLTEDETTVKKIAQAVGLANFLKVSAPKEFRHIFRRISEKTKGNLPIKPTKKDWEKIYDTKLDLTIQAKMEIIHWLNTLKELVNIENQHNNKKQAILYADTGNNSTGIFFKLLKGEWETHTLKLPINYDTNFSDASSTAREVLGIKRGLDLLTKKTNEALLVHVYCDNEASYYHHKSNKCSDNKTRAALTDINNLKENNNMTIKWHWHRRTTKVAKFTDYLSKQKTFIPKTKLREKVQTLLENNLKNIIEDQTFLKQLWKHAYVPPDQREKLNKHCLLIIHPNIYTDKRWDILDYLDQIDYKGALMMPKLTANPLRNMMKKKYKRIYISRNKLKKFFHLPPGYTNKNQQRQYIIFQQFA